MFEGPDNAIQEQGEIRSRKLQQRRETVHIDGLDHLEEADTMFWILGHILVDHVESTSEY